MKLLVFYTIFIFTGLTLMLVTPVNLTQFTPLEHDPTLDTYALSLDTSASFDSLTLSHLKDLKVTEKLKTFKKVLYTLPSTSKLGPYSKDSLYENSLDLNKAAHVLFNGYLFKNNTSQYYLVFNYSFDYKENAHYEHFIELNQLDSVKYNKIVHTSSILIDQKTYQDSSNHYLQDENRFYYKPTNFNASIKKATYQGLLILEIINPPLDYLSIDATFFETSPAQTNAINLGFNKFKDNSPSKYIPSTLNLHYQEYLS